MSECDSAESTTEKHADMRVLYQVLVQDLASFKQQQYWAVNYAIAAETALWGAHSTLRLPMVVVVVAVLVAVVTVGVVSQTQSAIMRARARLRDTRRSMSGRFQAVFSTTPDREWEPVKWVLYGTPVLAAVIVVSVVLSAAA